MTRADRREQILDTATEVFGRLGFEATRMQDVAKAAGIAKGLLYKHFTSKDALFRALVERRGSEYTAELRAALANADLTTDPHSALRAGLAFWLTKIGDQSAGFNVTDPGAHDAYDAVRSSLRAVVAEAVLTAAPTTPEPYALLIAALIQGAAENLGFAWRARSGQIGEEQALAILTAFCRGGLDALRQLTPPAG